MTDNTTVTKCAQCGAKMKQVGMEGPVAIYHCSCCGNNTTVTVTSDTNTEYFARKNELLSRTMTGIADWKTASWDYLRKDLLDFMSRYEDARSDIRLNMAVLACITHGFHYITAETYKECKITYKLTEKLYKATLRTLKQKPDIKTEEQIAEYKQNRALYKKCRNDYRNTKIAWKIVFSIFKKLLLK
jgi:hypothetical protein